MNDSKPVYPKRMLEEIKAVKERRRKATLDAIAAAAAHIKAELATPRASVPFNIPRRPRPSKPKLPSRTRVAATQTSPSHGNGVSDPNTLAGLATPPVLTNKRRRWLRKRFKKLPHGLFAQGHKGVKP
jgi:hypothetical protein